MSTVVFHNERTIQFIASVLLKLHSENSKDVDLVSSKNIVRLVTEDSEVYTDKDIILVGDLPPLQIVKRAFVKAKSLTYLGSGLRGDKLIEMFKGCHPETASAGFTHNSVLTTVQEWIANQAGYSKLKISGMENPPILSLLTDKYKTVFDGHFTKLDIDYIFRALSVTRLTEVEILSLLELRDKNDFISLSVAGAYVEKQHEDFIRRVTEKEIITVEITNNVRMLGISTNKKYCSCLAEAVAKIHGFGCAYYETEEYRHYELRANTKEGQALLKALQGTFKSSLGNERTLRFRLACAAK